MSGELAGLEGVVIRTAGQGDAMIAQCDFPGQPIPRALPAAALVALEGQQ